MISFQSECACASAKEHFVSADDHLHQLLVLQEQDVRCSSDHAVQVRLLDVEVHVQAVQDIQIVALTQKVVNHLNISTALLLVTSCITTDLETGRVEWRVLVLEGAYQDNVLEMFHSTSLT